MIGNLTVSNFFRFDLIGHRDLAYLHVSMKDEEPIETFDRIRNILPLFVTDTFNSDTVSPLDLLVLNSALWDFPAIPIHRNWGAEMDSSASD